MNHILGIYCRLAICGDSQRCGFVLHANTQWTVMVFSQHKFVHTDEDNTRKLRPEITRKIEFFKSPKLTMDLPGEQTMLRPSETEVTKGKTKAGN